MEEGKKNIVKKLLERTGKQGLKKLWNSDRGGKGGGGLSKEKARATPVSGKKGKRSAMKEGLFGRRRGRRCSGAV